MKINILKKKKNSLNGWVARDQGNQLHFFSVYPERVTDDNFPNCGCWTVYGAAYLHAMLPPSWYKDLKWENEPLKVELSIKEL